MFEDWKKSDLEKIFIEEKYAPNTPLEKKQLYYLQEGEVKISLLHPGDIEVEKGKLKKGALFGQVATLSGQPLREKFMTTKKTSCWIMTRNRFDAIVELFPELAMKLLITIAEYTSKRIRNSLEILQEQVKEYEEQKSALSKKSLTPLPQFSPDPASGFFSANKETLDHNKLAEMNFFLRFSSEEREELLRRSELFMYEKGCPFIQTPTLAIIYSGTLQEGAEGIRKISIVGPGKMFGALSIIDQEVTIFGVARENSTLITFSGEILKKMKKENYSLWMKLNRFICIEAISYFYKIERQLLRLQTERATL